MAAKSAPWRFIRQGFEKGLWFGDATNKYAGYYHQVYWVLPASIIDVKMNRQTESLLDLPLDEQNK